MDRRDNSNGNNRPHIPIILFPIYLLVAFFIAIGNTVRRCLGYIFSIPIVSYNTIKRLLNETESAVKSWISEKRSLAVIKKSSKKNSGTLYEYRSRLTHFMQLGKAWPKKIIISIRELFTSGISTSIQKFRQYRLERKELRQRRRLKQQQLKIATKQSRIERPAFNISLPKTTSFELIKSFITGIAFTVLFLFVPFEGYHWLMALPNPQLLSRRDLQVTTKIFDRKGVLLYEIYQDQNRTPLALASIPSNLVNATLSIEDRDFYTHQGISPKGILRALRETVFNKQVQGGSTITQQLIKSALLSPEIKITRKIKEVLLAFWAEQLYSKNQILEMYLNQVPYGGTAWGVEAASQTYFGKSAKNLNLAEATLLAGLPAAPTEYSPFGLHPQKAFERQKEVLRRMVEDRHITQAEATEALNTHIVFTSQNTAIRAPHFVMYIKNLLEQRYGERLVDQGGLQIKTSLDIGLQEKTEELVKSHIESLKSLNVGNGAALVTNPKTGEVLAMVGSKNYFDSVSDGNVNVTTSLRQPGSSIKVVNYAAALENGYTAASFLDDSPISYPSIGGPSYAPVNYDGRFHGIVPFRYALANSYNIPAVKILSKIGVHTMIETGKRMGITSWEDETRFGLSLTLGGGEVTMTDMAKVFGSLANNGKRMELQPILEVTDYTGRVYERLKPSDGVQAIKPETAWIISNILSDNTARIPAFGPNSSLVIADKTVSVKTGTTDNKRDNWTIGYTPSFVAAVWVGNNDNTPMNPYLTSGITGAAPIWHDIMVELLKNKPDEIAQRPENVVQVPCFYGRPEYFVVGSQPPNGRCVSLPSPSPSASPTP